MLFDIDSTCILLYTHMHITTDQYMDLTSLTGCSRVSIVMTIEPEGEDDSVRLLPAFQSDECPLDIIIDLMVCTLYEYSIAGLFCADKVLL